MEKTVDYMFDVIKDIHSHDRWYNFSEGKKTIALVENLMREAGMEQVETLYCPSDGTVRHGGDDTPPLW